MKSRHYLITGLCILILAGCTATPRYQLSKDDKGRLVRLDTKTGQIMRINDDKLVSAQPKTTEQSKSERQIPLIKLPNGGKAWPPITVPDLGNDNAALTTYWYNGKMHYVIELYPMSKRLKLIYSGYYNNPSFSLTLSDKNDKQVAWTSVPGNRSKHTFSKRLNTEELSMEGVIVMGKQEYDSIAGWQLQWNPR